MACRMGSAPIWATTPVVAARDSSVRSGTLGDIFVTLPRAMAFRMASLGISAQMTASFGCQSISRASSSMMSSVQLTCFFAPEPPAEPISRGMLSVRAPSISSFKSFLQAMRLTMAVPAPSLWGPASVLPASTTMASGCWLRALRKEASGKP